MGIILQTKKFEIRFSIRSHTYKNFNFNPALQHDPASSVSNFVIDLKSINGDVSAPAAETKERHGEIVGTIEARRRTRYCQTRFRAKPHKQTLFRNRYFSRFS